MYPFRGGHSGWLAEGERRASMASASGSTLAKEQAFDSMDRFDKFTDRARKVLTLAQDEAQRFNHNYIGTEHLLLGLVREGEGIAAGVLESLGVNLDKVRHEVIRVLSQSSSVGPAQETKRSSKTPTASAKTSRSAPRPSQGLVILN